MANKFQNTFAVAIPGKSEKQFTFANGTVLSESVGGTLYSTTPGGAYLHIFVVVVSKWFVSVFPHLLGTRVVYSRDNLLLLRNSPLVRSPVLLPTAPCIQGCEEIDESFGLENEDPIGEEDCGRRTSSISGILYLSFDKIKGGETG